MHSQSFFDHSLLNKVLQKYVDEDGYVNYTELQKRPETFDRYITLLEQISPENYPEKFPCTSDELAYWINAYNAFVLKGVIDHYPVKSVREIKWFKGFFWILRFKMGGKKRSLYTLENKVIRNRYKDPRIHFAINCASKGCPKLARFSYQGGTLDQDLEKSTEIFINDPKYVLVDTVSNKLFLSSIFDWYKSDFTDWLKIKRGVKNPTLIDYIELYLNQEEKRLPRDRDWTITYFEYDWNLNDQLQNISQN